MLMLHALLSFFALFLFFLLYFKHSSPLNLCGWKVNESFPFPILLSWKGSAPDAQNGGAEQQQLVFPKGNPIPSVKAVTFHKTSNFSVDVQCSDISDLQVPAKISTYTVIYLQTLIKLIIIIFFSFFYFCLRITCSVQKVIFQPSDL